MNEEVALHLTLALMIFVMGMMVGYSLQTMDKKKEEVRS